MCRLVSLAQQKAHHLLLPDLPLSLAVAGVPGCSCRVLRVCPCLRQAPRAFPLPRKVCLALGGSRRFSVTAGPPARRLTAVEGVHAVLRVQPLVLQLLPHPLAQELVLPHRVQWLLLPAAGGHDCAVLRGLPWPSNASRGPSREC